MENGDRNMVTEIVTPSCAADQWRAVFGFTNNAVVTVHDLRSALRSLHLQLALEGKTGAQPSLTTAYAKGLREVLVRSRSWPREDSGGTTSSKMMPSESDSPEQEGPSELEFTAAAHEEVAVENEEVQGDSTSGVGDSVEEDDPSAEELSTYFESIDDESLPSEAADGFAGGSERAAESLFLDIAKLLESGRTLSAPSRSIYGRIDDMWEAQQRINARRDLDRKNEQRLTPEEDGELDRLEAEALRQYGQWQAVAGRHTTAIQDYLDKAINLDPTRPELYTERATMRLHQEDFLMNGNKEHMRDTDARRRAVLNDCELALALDDSHIPAYKLTLPLLFDNGEFAEAQECAARGLAAVADVVYASELREEMSYASAVMRGVDQAEKLLAADQKRPDAVDNVVNSLEAAFGKRFEACVKFKLAQLRSSARFQRAFQEAAARSNVVWAEAWGSLGR